MADPDEPRDDDPEPENDKPREGEPWAKTSSGDADSVTDDE